MYWMPSGNTNVAAVAVEHEYERERQLGIDLLRRIDDERAIRVYGSAHIP